MSTAKITETARYLTFRLGEEVFAINVFKAREVLDLSHITRVPTAPGLNTTLNVALAAGARVALLGSVNRVKSLLLAPVMVTSPTGAGALP